MQLTTSFSIHRLKLRGHKLGWLMIKNKRASNLANTAKHQQSAIINTRHTAWQASLRSFYLLVQMLYVRRRLATFHFAKISSHLVLLFRLSYFLFSVIHYSDRMRCFSSPPEVNASRCNQLRATLSSCGCPHVLTASNLKTV